MADMSHLTMRAKLGFLMMMTQANRQIEQGNAQATLQNEQIVRFNKTVPPNMQRPTNPTQPTWKLDEFFGFVTNQQGGNVLIQNQKQAADEALAKIATMQPQEQASLLTAMGMADLLNIEDPELRWKRVKQVALDEFLNAAPEHQDAFIGKVYPELS